MEINSFLDLTVNKKYSLNASTVDTSSTSGITTETSNSAIDSAIINGKEVSVVSDITDEKLEQLYGSKANKTARSLVSRVTVNEDSIKEAIFKYHHPEISDCINDFTTYNFRTFDEMCEYLDVTPNKGISRQDLYKLTQIDSKEDINNDFFGSINRAFSEKAANYEITYTDLQQFFMKASGMDAMLTYDEFKNKVNDYAGRVEKEYKSCSTSQEKLEFVIDQTRKYLEIAGLTEQTKALDSLTEEQPVIKTTKILTGIKDIITSEYNEVTISITNGETTSTKNLSEYFDTLIANIKESEEYKALPQWKEISFDEVEKYNKNIWGIEAVRNACKENDGKTTFVKWTAPENQVKYIIDKLQSYITEENQDLKDAINEYYEDYIKSISNKTVNYDSMILTETVTNDIRKYIGTTDENGNIVTTTLKDNVVAIWPLQDQYDKNVMAGLAGYQTCSVGNIAFAELGTDEYGNKLNGAFSWNNGSAEVSNSAGITQKALDNYGLTVFCSLTDSPNIGWYSIKDTKSFFELKEENYTLTEEEEKTITNNTKLSEDEVNAIKTNVENTTTLTEEEKQKAIDTIQLTKDEQLTYLEEIGAIATYNPDKITDEQYFIDNTKSITLADGDIIRIWANKEEDAKNGLGDKLAKKVEDKRAEVLKAALSAKIIDINKTYKCTTKEELKEKQKAIDTIQLTKEEQLTYLEEIGAIVHDIPSATDYQYNTELITLADGTNVRVWKDKYNSEGKNILETELQNKKDRITELLKVWKDAIDNKIEVEINKAKAKKLSDAINNKLSKDKIAIVTDGVHEENGIHLNNELNKWFPTTAEYKYLKKDDSYYVINEIENNDGTISYECKLLRDRGITLSNNYLTGDYKWYNVVEVLVHELTHATAIDSVSSEYGITYKPSEKILTQMLNQGALTDKDIEEFCDIDSNGSITVNYTKFQTYYDTLTLSELLDLWKRYETSWGEYTAYRESADFWDSIAGDVFDGGETMAVWGLSEPSQISNHIETGYPDEPKPDWNWISYA